MSRSYPYLQNLLKELQDPEEAIAYLEAAQEEEEPNVTALALNHVTHVHPDCCSLGSLPEQVKHALQVLKNKP